MNLFINDTPFFLLRSLDEAGPLEHMRLVGGEELTTLKNQSGAVVITEVTTEKALSFLDELLQNHYEDVSFRILPEFYNESKSLIKRKFRIIDAAGGVVTNKKGKKLLIYRLKKWDLPKGKLDDGEDFKMAAKREVEEETGIRIKRKKRITTTWHTYAIRNKPILKRTKWYAMECLDDSLMKPQKGENIEKVVWMKEDKAATLLKKSYRSIRFVIDTFNALQNSTEGRKEQND